MKFKKQLLMNQLGVAEASKYSAGISKNIECKEHICIFNKNEYQVKFDINNNVIQIYKENILQKTYTKTEGADLLYIE